LTIDGTENIKLVIEDGTFHITGSYEIENRGDEIAISVFPKFQLGSWTWVGEQADLGVQKRRTWQIDEGGPIEKPSCKDDPGLCFPGAPGSWRYAILNHTTLFGYKGLRIFIAERAPSSYRKPDKCGAGDDSHPACCHQAFNESFCLLL